MAGNDTEGLRYGTIETKEKYYLTWKEDPKATDELSIEIQNFCSQVEYSIDKHLIGLCHKERFIEIIHDFIVFDRGIKKLCRPNQYFGVKAAQKESNHAKAVLSGILREVVKALQWCGSLSGSEKIYPTPVYL